MTEKENRESKRVYFTAQLRITYENVDQFENQFTGNISTSGIFIQTRNPKPPNTPMKLQVMLRDGRTLLEAEGVVCWNRQQNPASAGPVTGMGVRFTKIDEKYKKMIEKVVRHNSPNPEFTKLLGEHISETDDSPAPDEPKKGKAPQTDEEIVLGIDLGTTYSCCAYVENGRPKVIPSGKGYYVIPSVVGYYEKKEQLIVGHAALDQIIIHPENTIYGFKRLLGRTYHSPFVARCKDYFTYALLEGPNGEIEVDLGGKRYSLTDMSSLVLKEIHEVAEGTLQRKIGKAVISVPAYYNEQQRTAVKNAGEQAGLKVLKIVNEPTAAALAYGFNRGLQQTVMMYDLGGGTFDVSILRITGNVFETLATSGDNFLGGLDFDKVVMERLLNDFKTETGLDLSDSPVCLQRVRNAAEKMKIDLSSEEQTSVHLPFIAEKDGQPVDLRATLNRQTLNELTEALINQTLAIVEKTLADIKMEKDRIDSVLLVGGQTRMPLIAQKIEKLFEKSPNKGVHPDEVVALGACLYGYSLNQIESVLLKDVISMSIGIGLPLGKFQPIVEKNSPLPTEKKYNLATMRDNQTSVHIDIFQGDSEKLVENEYLGSFHFDGLPAAPKGEVKLALQFSLNGEAILEVSAVHEASGRKMAKRIFTKDTPDSLREAYKTEKGRSLNPTGTKGLVNRLRSGDD